MALPLLAMAGSTSALQGGGFGFGYGLGVRLGWDTYGAVKDMLLPKMTEIAKRARYSTDPTTSHAGSGFLQAVQNLDTVNNRYME